MNLKLKNGDPAGQDFTYHPKALIVLLFALVITAVMVVLTYNNLKQALRLEVAYQSRELQTKFEARLRANSQILRSGRALFSVSDTVTREEWKTFYINSRISTFYPGIQGFGYSQVIYPGELTTHIERIRESGFPDYNVTPEYPRDMYSSIIYLEPFSGRNLRAFGYDMYSEPIRRKAMQEAVDSNLAVMSGKVILVQETDEDVQPGFLIYVPVYNQDMPVTTVEERRAAIMGWVYSPFRIKDLTMGVFEQWEEEGMPNLRFQIYDGDVVSEESLMFDSHEGLEYSTKGVVFTEMLPVTLNSNNWTLVTTNEGARIIDNISLQFVFFSGLTISLLLFLFTSLMLDARVRSQEITQLNLRLQKVNADKDRFISILGHDLKNPFNNILGISDILVSEEMDKDESHEFIVLLNDVSKRTYRLLEELLEWARMQSGNFPFNPSRFLFSSAFDEVYGYINMSAQAKNVTIHYKENDLEVYADYYMLKTILRNLLTNAIKFSNPGGEVTVVAHKAGDKATVSVADNGVGMDDEKRKKLFVISDIITTPGTANEKGTGLGLILCKEFVDAHNGSIWVESEPGKGSKFYFTLPYE